MNSSKIIKLEQQIHNQKEIIEKQKSIIQQQVKLIVKQKYLLTNYKEKLEENLDTHKEHIKHFTFIKNNLDVSDI